MSKMDKVLLLANKIDISPAGGRELSCKLNHDIFKEGYGDKCTVLLSPDSLAFYHLHLTPKAVYLSANSLLSKKLLICEIM